MLSVLYTNLSEKLLVKMPSAKSIRAKNKQHYEKNVEKIKTFSRANSKAQYQNNPAPKKLPLVHNIAQIERIKKLPLVLTQRHDTLMTGQPQRHDTLITQPVKRPLLVLTQRHNT